MSTDIDKIKAEIKEWQRAYRRAHGRDPGKDELKKNPEMQAKYKLWQDSLKASKPSSRKQDDEASTPPRPSRSLIPKTMPVQSASRGPTTPFSARKKQVSRKLSSSSDDRVPAPDLSSAKRGTSSQSSRVIPFNSASKSQTRIFPSLLASDSDDDNPFAAPDPVSPSRPRRASPNKPLQSPSKTDLLRTPSKPKPRSTSPESQPFLTPRTKARKRMRGEEVPATPGDKRRKLGAARSILPTQDEQDEEDEDEIVDSPKKKRATAVNGRVFTGLFDDEGAGGSTKSEPRVEDASSVMDGACHLYFISFVNLNPARQKHQVFEAHRPLLPLSPTMTGHPPDLTQTKTKTTSSSPGLKPDLFCLPLGNGHKTPGTHPLPEQTFHTSEKDWVNLYQNPRNGKQRTRRRRKSSRRVWRFRTHSTCYRLCPRNNLLPASRGMILTNRKLAQRERRAKTRKWKWMMERAQMESVGWTSTRSNGGLLAL
ncbi:hypothetical protein B0J17DRAFT_101143 [Rhizoctonia solani]|nr:hypothetical protein B0J17DRAFT_101143 [Rhizoctonia solani]